MKLESTKLLNSNYCSQEAQNGNDALKSACGCAEGLILFQKAIDYFKILTDLHTLRFNAYKEYLQDKANWDTRFLTQKSSYERETTWGRDVEWGYLTGSCKDCSTLQNIYMNREITQQGISWEPSGDWKYGRSGFTCYVMCKRTADGVNKKMNIWQRDNPPPVEPPEPGNPPSFQQTFQCCENVVNVSDIQRIENVKQSCDQRITQQIKDAYKGITTTPVPTQITQKPTSTPTSAPISTGPNPFIIGIISTVGIIAFIAFIVLIFFN